MERHVYRLKWWAQAWYLALGVLTGGIGILLDVAVFVVVFTRENWGIFKNLREACFFTLLAVVFTWLGYLFSALALRSRVVLDGTRISVRYTWREKSADISEIEGYKVLVTKNATFWQLELKNKHDVISIMRSFRVDEAFRAFLSQLKNLDEDQYLVTLRI